MMTYTDKMLQAFVGKENNIEKLQWYKETFKKFEESGGKWKWSWWAFFIPGGFSFYRKTYFAGVLLSIVPIILIGIVVSMLIPSLGDQKNLVGAIFIPMLFLPYILSGGLSVYFIYRRYLKKKENIESIWEDEEQRVKAMKSTGGYSKVALSAIVVLFLLTFIGKLADKGMLDNVSLGGTNTPKCSSTETVKLVKQLLGDNAYLSLYTKNKELDLEMIRTVNHDKDLDRYICKAKIDFGIENNGDDMMQNIMLQALSNIKYSVSMTDDKTQFIVELLADQTDTYTDDD